MTAKQFVEVDARVRLTTACVNLAKAMMDNPTGVEIKANEDEFYRQKWLAYAKKHSVR